MKRGLLLGLSLLLSLLDSAVIAAPAANATSQVGVYTNDLRPIAVAQGLTTIPRGRSTCYDSPTCAYGRTSTLCRNNSEPVLRREPPVMGRIVVGRPLGSIPRPGVAANTADRISGPFCGLRRSPGVRQRTRWGTSNKHRADFPHLNNSLEYVAEAQSFLRNPGPGVLTRTRGNGDVVRYDPGSNRCGIMDSTGAPKTYFRTDPASHGYPTNLDYFNAQ